jgi:hypothetical protein
MRLVGVLTTAGNIFDNMQGSRRSKQQHFNLRLLQRQWAFISTTPFIYFFCITGTFSTPRFCLREYNLHSSSSLQFYPCISPAGSTAHKQASLEKPPHSLSTTTTSSDWCYDCCYCTTVGKERRRRRTLTPRYVVVASGKD